MIKINNIENFNLEDTITCGQIFRFIKEEDNSFTVILDDRVVNVKYENKILYVDSNDEKDLERKIIKYFDLDRDYNKINKTLIKNDKSIKEVVDSCNGLKFINSYPFETIISYIISSNNSVSSITKSVNKISETYGKKVLFKDKEYFLFPTKEELKDIKSEDYRKCSVGFRDKYIENIVKVINADDNYINKLYNMDSIEAFDVLQKEKGIGPKVASCILMFSYQKFDVFPVDTWVKKVMKDKYNIEGEKNIRLKTKELYGDYSAVAIQYMFHYGRNKKR